MTNSEAVQDADTSSEDADRRKFNYDMSKNE